MWAFDENARLCFNGKRVPKRLEEPIIDLIIEKNDLRSFKNEVYRSAKVALDESMRRIEEASRQRDELY